MNFKNALLTLGFISLLSAWSTAQTAGDQVIEQIMEYVAENIREDLDYSELVERLNYYKKEKLNLNDIGSTELQELVFITPLQIASFLSHREHSGPFLDMLELQGINGFDRETVLWLSNFATVQVPELLNNLSFREMYRKGRHDLMLRFGKTLEEQMGFMPGDSAEGPPYAGSGYRFFSRYRYHYANKIEASLNMEKDAGEPLLRGRGKGFDFYSASIFFKGQRLVKKLIVGDYGMQLGQGLTMWSGLGFGKGGGLASIAKPETGLRPYSSVNESSFLRGFSATLAHRNVSLSPFLSYRTLDASFTDDQQEISSFGLSGLHRTHSELENKNNVSQLVYGLNVQYKMKPLTLGVTAYHTSFGKPVAPGSSLYEKYHFYGSFLSNIGFHYSYTLRNIYWFGEAAHSISSGYAFVNGILASLSGQVSIVLLHRNYGRNYHSFFNQAFSENSDAVNEKGFYSGLIAKFNKLDLSASADFFRFPWLKYRVDAPSRGLETLAQASYSFNKRIKFLARFKQQIKEENALETGSGLDNVTKENYRLELNYKISRSFSLRNRVEFSSYRKGLAGIETGFLSSQDIIFDPLNSKLSGNLRFAIFDTGGFNSRIYAYENDVLYGYSVPGYQDRGLRFYSNIRYSFARGLDFWFKYSISSLSDQESIGSDNDLIAGNQRSEVKLQIRYQF